MSEVLGGKSTPDQLVVTSDKTQVYGLKGNDTIISNNHKDVLLIGGSGNDSLIMQGGNGTLSGGKGSDVFELNYSASSTLSAVIEDFEPSSDKIIVNFNGNLPAQPQLNRNALNSGDVVLKDDNGLLNVTLKSVRENDYFDGSGSAADDERFFEILKLTNIERENPTMPKAPDASENPDRYKKYTTEYEGQQELVAEAKTKNLPWLTLAEDLTDGASIRAEEITELALKGTFDEEKHTRPSGQSYATVIVDKELNLSLSGKYVSHGENLQAGASTPAEAVEEWIGSLSHHKNILDAENNDYLKLGVGYNYNNKYYADNRNKYHYWVQLFGGSSKSPATTVDLSGIPTPTVNLVSKSVTLGANDREYSNPVNGATISGTASNESINNTGLLVSISSGGGDDTIENGGANSTINAGAGNDSIKLSSVANLIQYRAGDGSDTVSGFNVTDTLSIAGDEYTPVTIGNDVFVNVGSDSIKLSDASTLPTFNIEGRRSKLFILRDDIADTLNNTVDGATIQALGGSDTITNSGANVIIEAGAGNDSLVNNGGKNVLFVYESGEDTIEGFNATSTLKIAEDTATSLNANGNLVLTVGTGRITFKNAAGLSSINVVNSNGATVTIRDAKDIHGDDTDNNLANTIPVDGATIQAFGGDDTITNSGNNVSIVAGAGKDVIDNSGAKVTIHGGAGDDQVKNSQKHGNVYIYESGEDTIEGFNNSDTLYIGDYGWEIVESDAGVIINIINRSETLGTITLKDYSSDQINVESSYVSSDNPGIYISNNENSTFISGTAGNDAIYSYGSNVTINALTGNDSIANRGINAYNVNINSGSGNDYVYNEADNVTIKGGTGADSIRNVRYLGGGHNVSINSGNAEDYVFNHCDTVTIDGGAGRDIIGNVGSNVIIFGGADEDSIGNSLGANVTIHGGEGIDFISNVGANVTILGEDGNDSIRNNGANVLIDGGADSDAIQSEGDNVTIISGTGVNSIRNDGSNVTIYGGEDNDLIDNLGVNVILFGGAGKDSIVNSLGTDVTMNGGAGNDVIDNSGANVTIIGASGNDVIMNDGSNVFINGGEGIDLIYSEGNNVSILGDAGNDRISLSSDSKKNVIQYSLGDGNDTVWGYKSNDTLNLLLTESDLKNCVSVVSGNDVVIRVGKGTPNAGSTNAGSIRIKDAKGKTLKVTYGESGTETGLRDGGSNNTSAPDKGGVNDNKGDNSQKGTSKSEGRNNAATPGRSATGSSGRGTSSGVSESRGGNSDGSRQNPTATHSASTSTQQTSSNNFDDVLNSLQQNPQNQPAATVNQHVYAGGNQFISNYQSGEKIIFGAVYTGSFFDNTGNYCVGSSTGALVVQNAMDKVIDLSDYAGNAFVKAYAASTAGVIDGRGIAGFEIINGSAGTDIIYAGDGSSQLWGGNGDAGDILVGGNGSDIFIGGKTQGADIFLNASSTDLLHLNDATLSDIVATAEENGTIGIQFNTGNVVAVQSSEPMSAAIMLADGLAYRYNHATKSWQNA